MRSFRVYSGCFSCTRCRGTRRAARTLWSPQQQTRPCALFINSQTNLSTPLHTHSTQNAAANSAVDTHAFADALAAKGYARLVIQKGAGAYRPRVLVPPGAARAVLPSGLEVE